MFIVEESGVDLAYKDETGFILQPIDTEYYSVGTWLDHSAFCDS